MDADTALMITLGLLLSVSPFVKSFLARRGVPPLVGYILLGFFVSVLNSQWGFVSHTFDEVFAVLAQLGVFALLFRVGLKSHTKELLAKLPDASVIWVGDVATNLVFGFVTARYLLSMPLETALMIATAFSATSVAVSVVVWDEMHKLRSAEGQLLVDVAELDDLSGVLLLAVLLSIIPALKGNGDIHFAAIALTAANELLKMLLFIVGCFLFANFLEARYTRFHRRWENSTTGLTIAVLGAGLTIAAMAGYLGFSLAIGALFAGLAFSRDPEVVHTDAKFSLFYEFFTPFFFIQIGMHVNPAAAISAIGVAAILIVPAILGKLLGVALPAMGSLEKKKALLLGLSMVPRAEIAMVIAYQCRLVDASVVPDRVFAALVVVSILTSILGPLALRSLLARQETAQG